MSVWLKLMKLTRYLDYIVPTSRYNTQQYQNSCQLFHDGGPYLCMPFNCYPKTGYCHFFFFTEYYYSLQLRFIYFCLFLVYKIHLVEVAIQKCLFKTESFKDFPNVLFYSVANVSELQNFRTVYSQEHLLMADSARSSIPWLFSNFASQDYTFQKSIFAVYHYRME